MSGFSEIYHFVSFCESVMGKTGPIVVDTRIIAHNREMTEEEEEQEVDNVILGMPGAPIDFGDVRKFLSEIKGNEKFQECFDSDRSYAFEGVDIVSDTKCEINWGS